MGKTLFYASCCPLLYVSYIFVSKIVSCGFRLCCGDNKAKYMENGRSDSLPIQQEAKTDV